MKLESWGITIDELTEEQKNILTAVLNKLWNG